MFSSNPHSRPNLLHRKTTPNLLKITITDRNQQIIVLCKVFRYLFISSSFQHFTRRLLLNFLYNISIFFSISICTGIRFDRDKGELHLIAIHPVYIYIRRNCLICLSIWICHSVRSCECPLDGTDIDSGRLWWWRCSGIRAGKTVIQTSGNLERKKYIHKYIFKNKFYWKKIWYSFC